jgi:outer membrane lipoprotein-sorting protein
LFAGFQKKNREERFYIMKKNKMAAIVMGIIFGTTMFMGCSIKKDTIIPEQLVTKAVKAYEKPKSYYGEFILQVYENDKLSEKESAKEWVDNSKSKIKRRMETESELSGKSILTNDGDNILIYMEKDKKAMKIKIEDSLSSNYLNYKDQFMRDLGTIAKTHELSFKGEETINGFKTYHLYAKPNKKNSLLGEVNYWIDKDDWFLVKSVSESANSKIDIEYKKIDFSSKLDSNLFTQKLPAGIEIEDLNDEGILKENVIDLKEAYKIAGKSILTLPESSGYKLKKVTYGDYAGVKHKEINQVYEKDGVEAINFAAIIPYEKDSKENSEDFKLPNEEDINVRGQKGLAMDAEIRCITWSEESLNYSFLIQDSSISLEEGKKLVESLQYTKQ